MQIKEILQELGYNLTPDKDGWRSNAIYRGGGNCMSLRIRDNGNWKDFGNGACGRIEDLISLTLGLKTIDEARVWLSQRDYSFELPQDSKPQIKQPKFFDLNVLDKLIPDHSYWIKRGISEEVIKLFRGGVSKDTSLRMKDRYVIPIFNHKNQILGLSGRALYDNPKIKYKIRGTKSLFKYPLILNHQIIKEKKEVILVEGFGCTASLWECGIKNSIVLFGTEMNLEILNFLIKHNIRKIIIALNNDKESGVGQEAAAKLHRRLGKYFDKSCIKIHLAPNPHKDFNEILCSKQGNGREQIIKWYAGT